MCWLGVLREGGVALGLAIVAFIWFGLSRTRTESIRPINQRHMTVTELLTILGVSLVLYGISLPPVISGPHRRRSPLPPASGVVPQADEGSKGAVSAEN